MSYARSLESARRSIRAKGRPVTFIKYTREKVGGDPIGPRDTDKDIRVVIPAVFVPLSSGLGYVASKAELWKECEQMCLVAPDGQHNLEEFNAIEDNGGWKINRVETLKPGDTTLLYFIGVARQ